MKKLFILTLITFACISCSSDNEISKEIQNRGTIEFDYKDEKLVFGERSYTGWILNDINDTIGYLYTARIRYGTDWKDFHDLRLYAYLENKSTINRLKLEFTPRQYNENSTSLYHYQKPDEPIVFREIMFDGVNLKAEFEGKLYSSGIDTLDFVEFKNGKINVPLKGLDIPDKY